jgi:hypothetical protein
LNHINLEENPIGENPRKEEPEEKPICESPKKEKPEENPKKEKPDEKPEEKPESCNAEIEYRKEKIRWRRNIF